MKTAALVAAFVGGIVAILSAFGIIMVIATTLWAWGFRYLADNLWEYELEIVPSYVIAFMLLTFLSSMKSSANSTSQ